jgi:NAD(P)-dependent dehydrogenase (short-subunit alcohol dehydrogenase family)
VTALRGSTALVTGAGRGIGAEIAARLVAAGARVMLADIDEAAAWSTNRRLADQGGEVGHTYVDISSPESAKDMVAATIERFGALDSLVNNAGIDAPPGTALHTEEADWKRIIDVNLSGAWWCIDATLPHMVERNSGRIVTISSLAARLGSERYSPAYAAAKAGLIGLTVGLAVQLEPHGILVNAITPGATGNTGTPMLSAEREELKRIFPLGTGGPGPVADGVRYFLDSSGDWLSGVVLNISGGQLRGI